MDECYIISDDEEYTENSLNGTICRPAGGNNLKRRVENSATEEDVSDSDIIYMPSDSDSDLPVIWPCKSDHNQSNKHEDIRNTPSTSNRSQNLQQHFLTNQESTSQQSTVIKEETLKIQIKDGSSDESLEREREDGGESFDQGNQSSRRDELAAMEYKSEDGAEEQANEIREENATGHWTKRDEPGIVDGGGTGNITTLGELLHTDTQSYSQVEPANNIFFDETWESLHPDLSGSSSVGGAPAPESPLPQGSLSSSTTDHEDNDTGITVQSTCTHANTMVALDCPDTSYPDHKDLLQQALQGKERLVLRKIRLPSDFTLGSIGSDSLQGCVYNRPKKDYTLAGKKSKRARPDSSDNSSSNDDKPQSPLGRSKPDTLSSEQADAKRKGKAKQKTRDDGKHKKKRQKVERGYGVHSVDKDGSSEKANIFQGSTIENQWPQGQSGGHPGKEDMCSPSLNEGTEEEPMYVGNDEDTHKLQRRLLGRKMPVISESDTDSDETDIEDSDAFSGKACSIKNAKIVQDSTIENHWPQGQSGGQTGKEDMCSPSLNEGTEEEPMYVGNDEDTHKLQRRLLGRKRPVISDSDTDSDETDIEDSDASSGKACSIKNAKIVQDSTIENHWPQGQSGGQTGKEDMCSSSLNEGTEEEPMYIGDDEDTHKRQRRLLGRKRPVISESDTDSDETDIEDSHASSGKACTFKSESLRSNTTHVQMAYEVSGCLRNSRLSADAVPPGSATLASKTEPMIGEGTSTNDLRPMADPAVSIQPDIPRSEEGTEHKEEWFRGKAPKKKVETIKGSSKRSSGRNGKSAEGLSESDKSASYRIEPISEGKTPKHRLIAVKTVSKCQTQKSKSPTTLAGEGLLSNDSHSQSEKLKLKKERELVSSPDEINAGTFYGTKTGPILTEVRHSMRTESWDEILREEPDDQEPDDESPSLVPLAKEQQEDENEGEEYVYPDTMPFSPREDMFDKNEDSEDFYPCTQAFSPMLDGNSENLTSDVGNESDVSQRTDPRDSPLHIVGDGEQQPTNYFPNDSQISCLTSDEEDPENTDAELATSSSYRSTYKIDINQQHMPTGEESPLQYFPTDSQLSISLDSEEIEELANQHEKANSPSNEEPKGPAENSGRKLLPCQQNAWSLSELNSQQRFLLLNEVDPEAMSQEYEDMSSLPNAEIQSMSTAARGNHATNKNNGHQGAKKNKSLQRPSRGDILLSTMKETEKQTRPVHCNPHSPSNPSGLSLGDPSKVPCASSVNSFEDCPKQAQSARNSAVAEDNAVTTLPRSMAGSLPLVASLIRANTSESSINQTDDADFQLAGSAIIKDKENTVTAVPKSSRNHLLAPSLCSPSSFYPANIADASISQTEGPDSHSGDHQTSHNIQETVKETQEATPDTVQVHHELKREDILACLLSWNTDWYEQHKEVSSSEVLQSFLRCKELSRSCKSYSDMSSYQIAFSCFLLVEMWCKVSCSVAEDCPGMWKQSSIVDRLTKDVVEVQYENQAEPHGMIEGDLVLVDMSSITATQKQFQFGLVQCNGPTDKTVCLALHNTTTVPSCTRIKVVTSLRHYLNQIRALLSFTTHPLARHIIKPHDSPVFAHETHETEGSDPCFTLLNSYMESLSRPETIRLMTGPPGTGKTVFLHRLVRWITRLHKNKTAKNPYKVLVCAPTSQSLDVLLRKVWEAIIKHSESRREESKHIVDGVRIVRVGKAEDANYRLTQFLLSTVAASMRKQGLPYDKLSEDELYTKVLQQADIVGCTLADCGSEVIRSSLEGNVYALIVDDASHCLETEVLLALQCRAKHVFMAGDQDQSIIHVRSQESRQLEYCHSMLQRLAKNFETQDKRIHRWEIQHRMKEEIANFPSKNFYSNRLKTPRKTIPFCLPPYVIFDLADGRESSSGGQVINLSEILFIGELLPRLPTEASLGIIAESSGQKSKLLERLQGNTCRFPSLLIGTPTDFYGLEKDVIILSCTCTSSRTPDDNGFVLNEQLLNLALTRAKHSLIIVGNMKSMQEISSHWKSLVTDATDKQLVFRTLQDSYRTNVKKCLSEQTSNQGASNASTEGHPQRSEGNGRNRRNSGNATPANPSSSISQPEQHPGMSSASRSRPPTENLEGQDRPTESSNYRKRYDPGPQGNPAYDQGHHPVEADPVMPSGVNSLPGYGGSGSRSSIALDRGIAPMDVIEYPLLRAQTGNLCRQSSRTIQGDRVVQKNSAMPRQRRISSNASLDIRGKVRVRFETETMKDNERARLVNTTPRGGILKRPHQNIAAEGTNIHQEEDLSTTDDSVQHNPRRQKTPVSSTLTASFRSTSNTTSASKIHRKNNHSTDGIRDIDNGKTVNSIATGMWDNQRFSTQQKGKNIAGRTFGKRKRQTSRRKESNEDHGRRPCGEVTNGETSCRDGRVEGPVHQQLQQQDQSNPRSRQQARPSQPIPERRGRRMETLNQLATNPIQYDSNMLHNRNVHERFGGRSTALTEPQPNIRRRRRSNNVKDSEMDYRD